jgi:hypothetical protein
VRDGYGMEMGVIDDACNAGSGKCKEAGKTCAWFDGDDQRLGLELGGAEIFQWVGTMKSGRPKILTSC